MAKGGSRSPRTSASTPRSRARPSSSATPTISRSGSPDAGGRAPRESRPTSSVISGTSGSSGGRGHEPVLLAEVLAQLDPHEGGRYLDGTVGAGGHAAAVLQRSRARGPLDMRADPDLRLTAADIVNSWSASDLRRVFAEYGEEPEAARIAGAIVRRRAKTQFETADELGRFVAGVKSRRPRGIDPATRVFQALRIAVNDELANLSAGLAGALGILRPGGRIAVISFHSLEDRIVKQFFARESRDCICPPHLPTCVCGHRAGLRVVTRRPLRAASAEVDRNPRARSAALRIAERLPLGERLP